MRLFLSLLLVSGDVLATETAQPVVGAATQTAPVSTGLLESSQISGQIMQLVLGLLLVIGLIFLLAWLVRRVQQKLPVKGSQQAISLLASQALGPRDRLLLVQVGKEQILLGLTPGTIVPLHVLEEPVEIQATEGQFSSVLAQRLAKVLNSNPKDKP